MRVAQPKTLCRHVRRPHPARDARRPLRPAAEV